MVSQCFDELENAHTALFNMKMIPENQSQHDSFVSDVSDEERHSKGYGSGIDSDEENSEDRQHGPLLDDEMESSERNGMPSKVRKYATIDHEHN